MMKRAPTKEKTGTASSDLIYIETNQKNNRNRQLVYYELFR